MDFQDNDIVAYESKILKAKIEAEELRLTQEQYLHNQQIEDQNLKEKIYQQYFDKVSQVVGIPVNAQNINSIELCNEVRMEILDTVFEKEKELIRSVHSVLPFSLIKIKPELQSYIPLQQGLSPLEYLHDKSTSRAFEIISEETSENTLRAHNGDVIYWQAWLSAIGFSFKNPISEKEILSFAIQHAEGLDAEIDHKLVNQNYKTNLGPHKLSTIKRRIGSLSVFLELAKLPNPCHAKELRLVLAKLTKKYGSSKANGKAITKDILNDMLEVCGDRLIDTRDKAALLFAWGTGGRRRSEVVEAEMKNLTTTPEGEFIYNMPSSKTDQEGKGHHVPIKGRVAKAVQDWLTASQITDGCIFRAISKGGEVREGLSAADINRIVKRRLKQAGYDETQFGAHSLRSGFVTEAGRKNKPIGDVMQLTTHKSITTIMKYYQAGNVINNSAANLAD